LLNALALVLERNARLVVVGHPDFARYERQAHRLGIGDRVRFLGHRADPRDCYFAADYLVHPTFYDPCSLVVLEALACGLPVVTSRYNGAAELLSPPADGVVIDDPHAAPELAAALNRMLDRGYLRDAGALARQAAARCTFEDHYRALLAVLTEARTGRRAA
jgi:UDP-glucose:(heptosyl)LPS alpha-1,3-glucosyltransferase